MTANELRTMYVNFFKERGHKEIASASLLPENDPTVLFTTAGMHPLVPYLLGEKHPSGKRLTDVQKKMSRFSDTEEKITGGDPLGKLVLVDRTQRYSMIWVSRNVVPIVAHPAIVASMLRFGIMSLCSLTKRQMVALQSLHRKMWIQEWAWNVY